MNSTNLPKNGRSQRIRKHNRFTPEELREYYVDKEMSIRDIADTLQVSHSLVSFYLEKFNIPTRNASQPLNKNEARRYAGVLTRFYKAYTYGAKTRNHLFELTIDQFENLVTQSCFFCGCPPSQQRGKYLFNGIDRTDNAIGYVLSNVRPCCKTCNLAKNKTPEAEFISWVLQVADYLRSTSLNEQKTTEREHAHE